MIESNVKLKIPKYEELSYRRKLLADEGTMTYNLAYGEDDKTGCIYFSENRWREWYSNWVDNMPERYYAYIISSEGNVPVGEVALEYNHGRNAYCANIVIGQKYRGKGFSNKALDLLINVAFFGLGAESIYGEFSKERISAEKAFKKNGFKRISDDMVNLTKTEYFS